MSHKPKSASLGRSLINARDKAEKSAKADRKRGDKKHPQVTQSLLEQTSLEDFLTTAEMAGTEFVAEKIQNIKIIDPTARQVVKEAEYEEISRLRDLHEQNEHFLRVPRRPPWTSDMSAEELEKAEAEAFLEWRRSLAELERDENLVLTPFERNLEFWRQLWRVVEKSDVLVQIVDARNPLMFRCEDLERYVKEVNPLKVNVLVASKADLLSLQQRKAWKAYFDSVNLPIAFWSSLPPTHEEQANEDAENAVDDSLILSVEQLIHFLRSHAPENIVFDEFRPLVIGMTGYPNVGKSSTINQLLGAKKVSVSATPGKTKHFQTLFLEQDLMLCDCPGLVMPSFALSKAEMLTLGILPIDQMRDFRPPIGFICAHVPREILERTYGVTLPPGDAVTADQLLTVYAYQRSFMSTKGIPDLSRAARIILRDFVTGVLCYCYAPPGHFGQDFEHLAQECGGTVPKQRRIVDNLSLLENKHLLSTESHRSKELDMGFFGAEGGGVHVVQTRKKIGGAGSGNVDKPWRGNVKRGKREKLRKVYKHLDA